MTLINKITLFLLLFIPSINSFAADYYLSNSGNDSNTGLSVDAPFKSIQKLNSIMTILKPGDVVYFERGSVFNGQINIGFSFEDINPVTFNAYGSGNNPVISGSVPVTGWTNYKGNISMANVDSDVKNIFLNNSEMTLARYPNSGFLKIDQPFSDPNLGFTDNELKQSKGYWDSSYVRLRSINWVYEYSKVKSFQNGAITFLSKTAYPSQSGWGYYLDNNLNELDTAGEWYFEKTDPAKGIVYFFPPENTDPNRQDIQGSVYDYGILSNLPLRNFDIRNIDFSNQNISGISFTQAKANVKIENCKFTGQFQTGISIRGGSENFIIDNCRFYNINGKAINIIDMYNSSISNNIIENTGMIPGYGTNNDAFCLSAIVILNSDGNHIYKNYIFNTGHDGINAIGKNNLIEKNILTNSMLLLNDGAAIKCYGNNTSQTIWKNNFILNVPGNLEATTYGRAQIGASGLYLDELSNQMEVSDNTLIGCALAGITFYNGGTENLIKNNKCYDNSFGINFYQGPIPLSKNKFENNIIVSVSDKQAAIQYVWFNGKFNKEKYYDNYFISPFTPNLFVFEQAKVKIAKNLQQWSGEVSNGEGESYVLNGEAYRYSKIYFNMSDEDADIMLNKGTGYIDVNNNSLSGKITVPPWNSEILFADKNLKGLPDLFTSNGPVNFDKQDSPGNFSVKWFVVNGENLSDEVNISSPAGLSIGTKENNEFSASLNIIPKNGKLNAIIFVKADNSVTNYNDFINVTSGQLKQAVKVVVK